LPGEDLDEACSTMRLSREQCQVFKEWFRRKMAELQDRLTYDEGADGIRTGTGRRLSRWQLCIASRMRGKPFDPREISRLAKEYREGRCP
jgi:hypothetical protein